MKAARFFWLLAAVVAVAFVVGRQLRPAPAPPAGQAVPVRAAPSVAARRPIPPPPQANVAPSGPHKPRFQPPPPPLGDSGLAQWLKTGSRDVTNEQLHSRDRDIGERLDELFGPGFPAEKRDKVLAAQRTAMTASAHNTWDYFHGDISQAELSTKLHQTTMGYAQELEGVLSVDEYRKFMKLEPGVDPMTAISTPGLKPGDPLPQEPGH